MSAKQIDAPAARVRLDSSRCGADEKTKPESQNATGAHAAPTTKTTFAIWLVKRTSVRGTGSDLMKLEKTTTAGQAAARSQGTFEPESAFTSALTLELSGGCRDA